MASPVPIVTIITLTYRKFDKIFSTINSVFNQTYPNIEYIISDDGSEDFPRKKIDGYIEANCPHSLRCTVMQKKENVVTVKNFNDAYKKAQGEYLINLSCGDVFFDENVVKHIVERFSSTNSDVIVTSRILYRDNFIPMCFLHHFQERDIISLYKTGRDQYKAFITSRFYDMASGSAMYFSRKIIQEMNYFDEKYLLWEDGPFLAKFLQVGKLEYAYDIISIWYEAGGVSYKSSSPSVKLQKDTELFIKNEKMIHIDSFSFFDKRMIQYRNYRFLYRTSPIRYLIYLVYFPELISCLLYSWKRKKRINNDLIEIKKIIEGKQDINIHN